VIPFLPENFIYFIVGGGPEKSLIEKTVLELNLNDRVFLLGQLENEKLSYVLNKTDIYISPNQHIDGNFESFGIAAGEAAALGIPVVSSRVDGISEAIVNNKNGLLIDPDSKSFISAINFLKDGNIRKKFGKKSKAFTKKNYNWNKTALQYSRLFASVGKN
jgi:phosphatidylinositol alpha-1,6-mannosyltransferase